MDKKTLFLLLVSFCVKFAFSAEHVWIGGVTGEWNNPENWSSGKVPNAPDETVVINATADTTITVTANVTISGIKVTGNYVVLIDGDKAITMSSSSGEVYSDIGEGATLKVDNTFSSTTSPKMKFIKRGKGVHQQGVGTSQDSTNSMYMKDYSYFEVAEGKVDLHFRNHANGLSCSDIVIRNGATLLTTTSNALADDAKVYIEEGGIFDGGNVSDCIGGFMGKGIAKRLNALYISCPVYYGPFRFDGQLHGDVRIRPSVYEKQGEVSERRFIVGSRDTLKNCYLYYSNEVWDDVKDFLQFAPDAGGVFEVIKIARLNKDNAEVMWDWDLKLEDTDGNPVEIILDARHGIFKTGVVSGKGSITHNNAAEWVITNEMIKVKGSVKGTPNASITIGDNIKEHDGVVSSFSIVLDEGAILRHKNVGQTHYADVIGNNANIYLYDKADVIFDGLSFTNGHVKVQDGYSEGKITINGGVTDNVNLYTINNTNGVITINGGDIHINNIITGENNLKWVQTGGTLRTDKAFQAYGNDGRGSPDIFYWISGGEVYSVVPKHGRGMGLEASGDAKVFLSKGTAEWHRISSDDQSYTLRIKDNALVSVDGLYLASGAPNSTKPYTTTVDLQGGELRVSEGMSILGKASDYPTYEGKFLFNGGLLHSVETNRTESKTWPFMNLVKGVVQKGGMHFKTSHFSVWDTLLCSIPLLTDETLTTVDGGVTKYGRGVLQIQPNNTYTGPTYIGCGGGLRFSASNSDVAPCGKGSIEINNGSLISSDENTVNISYATGEGSTLTFDGASFITAINSGSIVLGNPAASEDSVLVRKNKGVLLLGSINQRNVVMGDKIKVKVNGGVSCDASTGLVNVPVFQYTRPSSGDRFDFHPLSYSNDKGFVGATTVEGFGGGANSIAAIKSSTAYTIDSDTQVAGLVMNYKASDGKSCNKGLTIASGATLKLGNDKGYAPLIFNNYNLSISNPSQSIEGSGAIDFGNAEGIILVSPGYFYNNWYKVVKVNCSLKGSNGITFAGGPNQELRSDISLSNVNTFTGGAVIQGCTVIPLVNNSLGQGTVTVQGNEDAGGEIWITNDSNMSEITNPLNLSGNGYCYWGERVTDLFEPEYGALRADRSVNVKGNVTLSGNTRISAYKIGTRLVFSKPISGGGDLTLAGSGYIALNAANTFEGKTIVEGLVEIGEDGSFGTGDVVLKKDAVLKFTNSSPKTIPNNISGEGKVIFAGTAKVTFTGKVDVDCNVVGTGALGGSSGIVKNDDGVLFVTATNTYTGATEINNGTVVLGAPNIPSEAPFAEDISVRLDASATSSIVCTEDDAVVEWHDADGRGIVYTQNAEAVECLPHLRSGVINSKPSIYFAGAMNRLTSTSVIKVKNVFAVYRILASGEASTNPNKEGWQCMGLFGKNGIDRGIRIESTSPEWGVTHWLQNAQVWNNGVQVRKFSKGTVMVSAFMMSSEIEASTAVGHYWGSTSYPRGFWGDIAEIIVYNRQFDEDERKFVEAYLAKKWGADVGQVEAGKFVDLLPTQSDVNVAEGATLELNGADQSFTSLSGAGDIVNNSEVSSVITLSSGALDDFAGTISGNVTIKVIGNVTIPEGVTIAPTVNLILGNGVIVDLDGRRVTVNNASGSGIIKNGELVVLGNNNLSSPATTIIIR